MLFTCDRITGSSPPNFVSASMESSSSFSMCGTCTAKARSARFEFSCNIISHQHFATHSNGHQPGGCAMPVAGRYRLCESRQGGEITWPVRGGVLETNRKPRVRILHIPLSPSSGPRTARPFLRPSSTLPPISCTPIAPSADNGLSSNERKLTQWTRTLDTRDCGERRHRLRGEKPLNIDG